MWGGCDDDWIFEPPTPTIVTNDTISDLFIF